MIWKPNTTVAAIVEQDGRFLLVEEETANGMRLNQPAGHLEDGESMLQAVVRETSEETAYDFMPESLLGVYHWRHPNKDLTYLRFAFIGKVSSHDPAQKLDEGIIRAVWMSADKSAPVLLSTVVHKCLPVLSIIWLGNTSLYRY